MGKFDKLTPAAPVAPIATTDEQIRTHEMGLAYAYEAKSELYLLAVQNMVSEDTFYESAAVRDERFAKLVHEVTLSDPAWIAAFIPYLRDTMNMRSASIVMAVEFARARSGEQRSVTVPAVSAAMQRADEPGEMLAYWRARYGRKVPQVIKLAVADAVTRLYNERAALRYDGTANNWRMGDVIELVHPQAKSEWQSRLFQYLLDKRHHGDADPRLLERNGDEFIDSVDLPMLRADFTLRTLPDSDRRSALGSALWADAGWSWERLSGWLPGGMDAQAWEAVIPQMGYMALLRNLRNFDEAKISPETIHFVATKLADPDEVARSRQFPFRFYSAFKEIGSLVWAPALERALDLSLNNVPSLPGRTLYLVDWSGSMWASVSGRSKRNRAEIATLFAMAMAKRSPNPTVIAYGSNYADITDAVRRPLLQSVNAATSLGGTNTFGTLSATYAGHDRVVIVTDEQAHDSGAFSMPVPDTVPIYTFNLAGYRPAHMKAGSSNRYTLGGLNDAAFRLLPMLEGHGDGSWPFLP